MSAGFQDAWQAFAAIPKQFAEQFTQSLGDGGIDPINVMRALAEDFARDPARWHALQQAWYDEQRALWSDTPASGTPDEAAIDRRFRAQAWREPWFQQLARSYLATSRWLTQAVAGSALPQTEKRRAAFLMRQWVDAMCPANFAWSNPEALQRAQIGRAHV